MTVQGVDSRVLSCHTPGNPWCRYVGSRYNINCMGCVAWVLLLTVPAARDYDQELSAGFTRTSSVACVVHDPVLCCAWNSSWCCDSFRFNSRSGVMFSLHSQTMYDITESDVFYLKTLALLITLWSRLLSLLQGLAERSSCLQTLRYTHCHDMYLGKQSLLGQVRHANHTFLYKVACNYRSHTAAHHDMLHCKVCISQASQQWWKSGFIKHWEETVARESAWV
jgi:hypothetical protein